MTKYMLPKNLVEGSHLTKVVKGHNPQHPHMSCTDKVLIFSDAAFSKAKWETAFGFVLA